MKCRFYIMFAMLFVVPTSTLYSQTKEYTELQGLVIDEKLTPIESVTIYLKDLKQGTLTNNKGEFKFNNISTGKHIILITSLGFNNLEKEITISRENKKPLIFTITSSLTSLDNVELKLKSIATKIEETGFAVQAVETKKLKAQSLDLNKVLDRTPGIRVRTTGGVGSNFEYSLDGMSGNAIRFFIDGIPMDYYGASYSINNLPISFIKRIDTYKGVVPVALGSDALGGAINLISKEEQNNFLEASYSFGSFNTHKIALHGQLRSPKTGFTGKISSFYTYSDNNYKVWGDGVFYGDDTTHKVVYFTKDNPSERFNDDFKTATTKLDLGYTNTSWVDKLLFSILTSDLKKGVQTAQTMARVFGKVRNNEQTIMPNIVYQKKDFLTKGLNINTFAGYSYTKGTVVDTSSVDYDWRGKIITQNNSGSSGGEMGYDGKSLYTLKDHSQIYRANLTYQLPYNIKLGINYLHQNLNRSGSDPYSPRYRIPYIEPQKIASNFAGLSLETKKLEKKWHSNVFLKFYEFIATINEQVYTNEYIIIKHQKKIPNWGAGFASSFKITSNFLVKASAEQATRMPNAREALGDGVNITNNPNIKPEQSFNINIGAILGKLHIANSHGLKLEANVFYRNTKDKLLLNVVDARDNGAYKNLDKIAGMGTEIGIIYDYNDLITFNINATYLDYKNKKTHEENGNKNIFYNDRMPNQPYFTANAGLEFRSDNIIQQNSKFFSYIQSSYVHQFYLDWPSAVSSKNKAVIPAQLVFDMGVGYTFPSEKLTLAVDGSNLFNQQVFDNYKLQKPGRAVFIKLTYQLEKLKL
ncbi:TonB-dependent receptor [Wenyingzhuangia sp. IMCC45467]